MRNQGAITLTDGTPTLGAIALTGNYTGSGDLNLDVVLNAGNAATSADQLVITGDSIVGGAPTIINLTNVGGAGALTTGNGILLVSVSGTSATEAFRLPGPGYVDQGGFRYSLVQVGKNWYLQSKAATPMPSAATPVPTLGSGGLAALVLAMMMAAGAWFKRQRRAS